MIEASVRRMMMVVLVAGLAGVSCVSAPVGESERAAASRLAATSSSCESETAACFGEGAPCGESASVLVACASAAGCDLSSDPACLDSFCATELGSFGACFVDTEECLLADACVSAAEAESVPDTTRDLGELGYLEDPPSSEKLTGALSDCAGVGELDGVGNVTRQLALGLWPEPGFSKTFYPIQVVRSDDGTRATFTGGAGFAYFRGELQSEGDVVRGTLETYDFADESYEPFVLAPVALPESGFLLGGVSSEGAVLQNGGFWQLACVKGAPAE